MLFRRRKNILAEFSKLPSEPAVADVSAIGRLVMDEYLSGKADQVILVYTDFINLLRQIPRHKQLLPLSFDELPLGSDRVDVKPRHPEQGPEPAYIYEPGQQELISSIVPRLTELQIFQAITESLASEHAARMVAMRNATDNAMELSGALRLEYNKARQQAITSDMLDIAGGAEALSQA
jgi:F-type H+-transporting ATPase subunit gamma